MKITFKTLFCIMALQLTLACVANNSHQNNGKRDPIL